MDRRTRTVGSWRDGDAFIHNDARYRNIHNTDQSMICGFYDGELHQPGSPRLYYEGEKRLTRSRAGMPQLRVGLRRRIRMSRQDPPDRGREDGSGATCDLPAGIFICCARCAKPQASVPGTECQAPLAAAEREPHDGHGSDEAGRARVIASRASAEESSRGAAGGSPSCRTALPGNFLRLPPAGGERPRLIVTSARSPVRGRRETIRLAGRSDRSLTNSAFKPTSAPPSAGHGKAMLGFSGRGTPCRGSGVMNPMEG